MKKTYIITLALTLLACVVTPSFSQSLDSFLNNINSYNAFRLQKQVVLPGGGLRKFVYGSWIYEEGIRKNNTRTFFSSAQLSNTISSNYIHFTLTNRSIGYLAVHGAEIHFDEPTSLESLGYSLVSSEKM